MTVPRHEHSDVQPRSVLLATGLVYFRRTERTFADVI